MEGKIDWKDPIILEGKVTRIQYSINDEDAVEYIMQNYKTAYNKADYNVLTAISHAQLDPFPHTFWSIRYYSPDGYGCDGCLGNDKFGFGIELDWTKNHAFIAAKVSDGDRDIYAIAYIAEKVEKDDNYEEKARYILITQDVIEVEAVETGLVSVDNIANDINAKGHIAIYDIHFETGKSAIMPESANALKIIADYINTNSNKKYFIVGHTDNTGNFTSNMTLSEERTKSVISELISKFNVNEEQLKACGVSSLSPVANNATENGRAKNRRVEIVEQ